MAWQKVKIHRQLSWGTSIGMLVTWALLATAFVLTVVDARTLVRRNSSNDAAPYLPSSAATTCQTNQWIMIPDWLSGTWRTDSEIILDKFDYQTGTNAIQEPTKVNIKRESTIGMQRDSSGRVWYCASTPYKRTLETSEFFEYQEIERIALLGVSPNQVSVDSIATISRVDKRTKELVSAYKEETVTNYSPLEDGLIQVTYDISDVDLQGRPISSSKACCTETRSKRFSPIDRDERGDLRLQFEDYLLANNLAS